MRVEEGLGASVDTVGEHDGARAGAPQRLDKLRGGRDAQGAGGNVVGGGWEWPHEIGFGSFEAGPGLHRVLIVPARKRYGCREDESDDEDEHLRGRSLFRRGEALAREPPRR